MSAYRKGVRLAVTIAPRCSQSIDDLLETGLFGRSRAEVAQRMIYRFLQEPSTREMEALGRSLRRRARR